MRSSSVILAALACASASSGAGAFVVFGFAPAANSFEPELFYSAGNANTPGSISFSNAVFVDLVVDASGYGAGYEARRYTARVSMDLEVGPVTASGAPITGTIAFRVAGADFLIGTIGSEGGRMTGFAGAGSLLFSNEAGGGFAWSHAGVLSAFLPQGFEFNGGEAGSFALTNVFNSQINEHGYYGSFAADAAFTGHGKWIIPEPGAIILLGASTLASAGRRRQLI